MAVTSPFEPAHFTHSLGLLFIDHDPDDDAPDVSFYVAPDGEVVEYLGWGARGPIPHFDHIANPPPNNNFHTVAVAVGEGVDDEAAADAIWGLIEEHQSRWGVTMVWGQGPSVEGWLRAGMPRVADEVEEEGPETDDPETKDQPSDEGEAGQDASSGDADDVAAKVAAARERAQATSSVNLEADSEV